MVLICAGVRSNCVRSFLLLVQSCQVVFGAATFAQAGASHERTAILVGARAADFG